MTIHDDISRALRTGDTTEVDVTLVFKEITDEGDSYYVAECLEIPGCVSQGDTREAAEANLRDAIGACLNVMFMDVVKKLREKTTSSDLRGIAYQRRMTIGQPHQELQLV